MFFISWVFFFFKHTVFCVEMLLLVCCTCQHNTADSCLQKLFCASWCCFFFWAEIESRLRQRVSVPCKGMSLDILAKMLGFIYKHLIFSHYALRRLICAAKLFLTLFWCPDENNHLMIAALQLDALVINHIISLFWWANWCLFTHSAKRCWIIFMTVRKITQ